MDSVGIKCHLEGIDGEKKEPIALVWHRFTLYRAEEVANVDFVDTINRKIQWLTHCRRMSWHACKDDTM